MRTDWALGNLMWNRRRLVIGGGQKRATREGWGGVGDLDCVIF